ncbi:protein phosphatase 2C domain-containing protein [Kytococcus sedentarius]|uniref:Protein phosphatase 2C n=2 Tax=Kytococcus TaxID=57499 RepID=A0A212U1E5_9MICO|nr:MULTISPECIES: protein phosphatase 2C domain-containing protein [Kytococcus]ACV06050.1 hypothetical protein Ksed_10050 [Kytococcus sedentarius DSM 20547]QQB64419.1 protein phosphatase 2C domain-containing protein [Kytococcus sedentarius]SNC71944.1 Protein phosphatase 2C [Kytococcus aerolatus]STX12532.1 Uncharacterised protein [Kytococcus sedentarius]
MAIDPRMLGAPSPEVGASSGAPLEPGELIRWAAHTQIPCQDAVAQRGGVLALADGAGVGPAARPGCEHEVDWFSQRLVDAVVDHLSPADALGPVVGEPVGLREAVAHGIEAVRAAHPQCDADTGPWSTLTMARVVGDELEFLALCDSSLIVEFVDGQVLQVIDDRLDGVNAPGASMNAPGGWWSARGDVRAAEEARTGSFPLADVRRAWLASDGATRPLETWHQYDAAEWARRAAEDTLALAHSIRTHETETAAEMTAAGRKAHDDLTILRVV